MARARYIKPEFFKDEDLARVSLGARLLFVGLWSIADRAGRLEDRPLRIKAELFPYEGVEIEPLLAELTRKKAHGNGTLIERYEVSGRRYIQISNFEKHQKCHVKEQPSTLPGPDRASPGKTGASPPESEPVNGVCDGVGVGKPELAQAFDVPSSLTADQRVEYGRQVWEAWVARRGRGGPEMSNAEWSDVILRSMDENVPLRVVLQGIADCRGKLDPGKSLLYAKPAILAEVHRWQRGMSA